MGLFDGKLLEEKETPRFTVTEAEKLGRSMQRRVTPKISEPNDSPSNEENSDGDATTFS